MSKKKKKKGKHNSFEVIVLATSIFNLVISIIGLIKELIN